METENLNTGSTEFTSGNGDVWQNWHKTKKVGGHYQLQFEPNNGEKYSGQNIQDQSFEGGLKALLDIVENAIKSPEPVQLRAFGSKWSLNNVAFTDVHLVKTWGLNYGKVGLDSEMVTAGYKDKADKLCFVQSGVMIKYLNDALFDKKLALKTSGASDGQRLVGAISTGTHGSAMKFGAMEKYVKGIHLVVPDGDMGSKHIFIQRKTDVTVNGKFAAFLNHTLLIEDDQLFNAAVVSFGCFGLVHGVLIEVEKLYQLRSQTVRFNHKKYQDRYNAVIQDPTRKNLLAMAPKHKLFNWLEGDTGYPYFVNAAFNPYPFQVDRNTLFLEVMEKVVYDQVPNKLEKKCIREHELHGSMAKTFHEDNHKKLFRNKHYSSGTINIKGLSIGLQFGLRQFYGWPKCPWIARFQRAKLNFPNCVFSSPESSHPTSNTKCPATSMEIAVPISHILQVVEVITTVLQTHLLAAPLAMRFLPKSSATLAFNQYDDFTVMIELPGPDKGEGFFYSKLPEATPAHNAIFAALEAHDIPHAFHWGQQLPLNKLWVPKSYGKKKVNDWETARARVLQTPKARSLFSNQMTRDIGLTLP